MTLVKTKMFSWNYNPHEIETSLSKPWSNFQACFIQETRTGCWTIINYTYKPHSYCQTLMDGKAMASCTDEIIFYNGKFNCNKQLIHNVSHVGQTRFHLKTCLMKPTMHLLENFICFWNRLLLPPHEIQHRCFAVSEQNFSYLITSLTFFSGVNIPNKYIYIMYHFTD